MCYGSRLSNQLSKPSVSASLRRLFALSTGVPLRRGDFDRNSAIATLQQRASGRCILSFVSRYETTASLIWLAPGFSGCCL
jgi:hypothetical protein